MTLNKQKAFHAIEEIAKESQATEVYMASQGFPEPEKISYQGGFAAKKYVPDAILEYSDSTDIFSIEPSLSKKVLSEALHKWILFSSTAKKKNGNFYLVVDEEKEEDFVRIIKSKMIAAQVIAVKAD